MVSHLSCIVLYYYISLYTTIKIESRYNIGRLFNINIQTNINFFIHQKISASNTHELTRRETMHFFDDRTLHVSMFLNGSLKKKIRDSLKSPSSWRRWHHFRFYINPQQFEMWSRIYFKTKIHNYMEDCWHLLGTRTPRARPKEKRVNSTLIVVRSNVHCKRPFDQIPPLL